MESTLSNDKVVKYCSHYFVNSALRADDEKSIQLMKRYKVTKAPVILFIGVNGELIRKHEVFVNSEELMKALK